MQYFILIVCPKKSEITSNVDTWDFLKLQNYSRFRYYETTSPHRYLHLFNSHADVQACR